MAKAEVFKVKARWYLQDDQRPWTMNSERSWHWSERADRTRNTRERFFYLAKQHRVPKLEYVSIDIVPLTKATKPKADPAACYPAAKAAIDGLVDAKVIPDDNGEHIKRITFWSPIQAEKEALRVVIQDETDIQIDKEMI